MLDLWLQLTMTTGGRGDQLRLINSCSPPRLIFCCHVWRIISAAGFLTPWTKGVLSPWPGDQAREVASVSIFMLTWSAGGSGEKYLYMWGLYSHLASLSTSQGVKFKEETLSYIVHKACVLPARFLMLFPALLATFYVQVLLFSPLPARGLHLRYGLLFTTLVCFTAWTAYFLPTSWMFPACTSSFVFHFLLVFLHVVPTM